MKSSNVDLGLAISGLHARKGVPMTCDQIAAYCGVSRQHIDQIYQRAMRKLRNKLLFAAQQNPELVEIVDSLNKR